VAIARSWHDPASSWPTSPRQLDLSTGEEIIELLKRMSRGAIVTIITATHDFKMLAVSDRVIWIVDGRIDRSRTASS
jgi:putative ABC transport system ATP-binding protein